MPRLFLLLFLLVNFSFSQDWKTDLEAAKQQARQEDKQLLVVFQGSDWCAPCMKLNREIFESEYFKEYAASHYVMLQADFPRKKGNQLSPELQQQNNELAAQYNKNGYFPLVVVFDKNLNLIGKTGYKKMTPELYIEHLNSFK
ncbi:MAG: thioredoxin family protein [Flavobacteriaceae bacterium]|nr:thioredoxin family protein [Flavobacteriaceae bacterium]